MKPQTTPRKDVRLSDWINSGRERYLGTDEDRASIEAAERLASKRPVFGCSGALRVK